MEINSSHRKDKLIDMEEREIDLIDMIADILSHWRGLLVSFVLGAALLGAFSYVQSYHDAEDAKATKQVIQNEVAREDKLAQLNNVLNETQKMAVSLVMDDEKECALRQQYADTSVTMQMDAYNIPRKELVYKLQVEDMGQSYMLGIVYEDLVNNVSLYQWVEEQTGISATAARELIGVDAKSTEVVLNGAQETTFGNDSMKIVITHADEAECEKLAKAVKSYVEKQQELLAQEMGAHELVLLSESSGVIMDTGILDKQINYRNTRLNLLNGIAKAKDAFTKEQQLYYELLTQPEMEVVVEKNAEAPTTVAVPAKLSVSMKYVLIGAVLFAFVYAGILFVMYILNGKLRASDELQNLYRISQLGLIVKESKKQFFLDKWIEALRNHGKRRFTREQSLALAATAVKISAVKNGLDSICLMGCDLKAGADIVCDNLKAALEKEQIAVMVLDNVIYDAAAMEKLEHIKGVVLVEKAGSTMYQEVAGELELVTRQGIKVLGGIVVA